MPGAFAAQRNLPTPMPAQPPASIAAPGQVRCDVCETIQPPATECANCGMKLKLPVGVRPVADAPIEIVEGLETNAFADVGAISLDVVPDLEPTVAARIGEVGFDSVEGFEANLQADVLDLPGEEDDRMSDLEPTSDVFQRTAGLSAGLPSSCPYCGHVQPSGRICDNCGMSRSRVLAPVPVDPSFLMRPAADERVRCRACGSSVTISKLCSDCGMPLPEGADLE